MGRCLEGLCGKLLCNNNTTEIFIYVKYCLHMTKTVLQLNNYNIHSKYKINKTLVTGHNNNGLQ